MFAASRTSISQAAHKFHYRMGRVVLSCLVLIFLTLGAMTPTQSQARTLAEVEADIDRVVNDIELYGEYHLYDPNYFVLPGDLLSLHLNRRIESVFVPLSLQQFKDLC